MKNLFHLLLIVGLFTLLPSLLNAQNKTTDLDLLANTTPRHDLRAWKEFYKNPQKKKTTFVQAINPFYWVFSGLLTGYQQVISPQLSATCVYEVSCSRFSRIAIKKYGIIKGIALTADRLSRCTKSTHQSTPAVFFTSKGKVKDLMLMLDHKHKH